nr:MGMT family protein [Fodinicola feengrottensis]
MTYGWVTAQVGAPRERVRAVAAAIGANPLLVVRPCHRVIGADGSLTGLCGWVGTQGIPAHPRGSAAAASWDCDGRTRARGGLARNRNRAELVRLRAGRPDPHFPAVPAKSPECTITRTISGRPMTWPDIVSAPGSTGIFRLPLPDLVSELRHAFYPVLTADCPRLGGKSSTKPAPWPDDPGRVAGDVPCRRPTSVHADPVAFIAKTTGTRCIAISTVTWFSRCRW